MAPSQVFHAQVVGEGGWIHKAALHIAMGVNLAYLFSGRILEAF